LKQCARGAHTCIMLRVAYLPDNMVKFEGTSGKLKII